MFQVAMRMAGITYQKMARYGQDLNTYKNEKLLCAIRSWCENRHRFAAGIKRNADASSDSRRTLA